MRRLLFALALAAAAPAGAKTIALLVGVGNYPALDERLAGPPFDIPAVTTVLTTKMGVAAADIRTLLDSQATAAAIRAELKALVTRSARGDTVIVYFSGHGTSGRDPGAVEADLPFGTGAFVPFDFHENRAPRLRDRLIVGRFDIGPLALKPLDDGGRTVLVFFDSCFSGNAARGVQPGVVYRYLPIGDDRDAFANGAKAAVDVGAGAAQIWPYRNVIMLAASAETEKAADLPGGRTLDGQAKGAFTDALLRVFAGREAADFNGDGVVSFAELNRAQIAYMAKNGLTQSPQLLPAVGDDQSQLIFRAVPGLKAVATTATPRFGVGLAGGAEALRPALAQIGGVTVGAPAPDLKIAAVAGGYRITSAAGDIVLDSGDAATVVTRVKGGQWLAGIAAGARAPIDVRAATVPETRGGTFVAGRDTLRFAATASTAATLLIVDLWADGTISTVYPALPAEGARLDARTRVTVPAGAPIRVTPPAGTDRVAVFAFPTPPPGLDQWRRLQHSFASAEGQAFATWLGRAGPYAVSVLDVRIVAGPR